MSNVPVDGGWSEYQRLVLAELERHNQLMSEMNARQTKFELDMEFLKRDMANMLKLDERLRKLENEALTGGAVAKYRKWLIGGALLLITSVVIPLINLYVSGAK